MPTNCPFNGIVLPCPIDCQTNIQCSRLISVFEVKRLNFYNFKHEINTVFSYAAVVCLLFSFRIKNIFAK